MSFSSKVKEELSRQLSSARHCQIAEIAAILSLCGRIQISENDRYRVKIHTENEAVARKYFTLLKKTFNIGIDVSIRQSIGNHRNRTCTVAVTHHEDAMRVLQAVKLIDQYGEIEENLSLAQQCGSYAELLQARIHPWSVSGSRFDQRSGKVLPL